MAGAEQRQVSPPRLLEGMSQTMFRHPLRNAPAALPPRPARRPGFPARLGLPARLGRSSCVPGRLLALPPRPTVEAEGGELARASRLALLEAPLLAAAEPMSLRRLVAAATLSDAAEG